MEVNESIQCQPVFSIGVREAAKYLGVSKKTIYQWISNGVLPDYCWFRLGKRVLILKDEFTQFVKGRVGEGASDKAQKIASVIYNEMVGTSSRSQRKKKG